MNDLSTRKAVPRTLGLSVFNPDDYSSSDEEERRQPVKPLPQAPALTKAGQSSSQQQLYHPAVHHLPNHSASSSTSSIAIPPSSSYSYSQQQQQQYPHPRSHSPTARSNVNASPYPGISSSASSRSSPAQDSTPPITPANGVPPVQIANGDYDGLGLHVSDTYDTDPQGLAKRPHRIETANSEQRPPAQSQSQALFPPTNQPTYDRAPPVDRTIITATADAENHVIVDITGATEAAVIRKRIFSKLHIPEEEQSFYAIYRTELGEHALGEPVTDDSLMIYCSMWGDPKGTLKFLVQKTNTGSSLGQTKSSPGYNHLKEPSTPYINPAHQFPSRPSPSDSSLASTSADRDRPPWDKLSNGYEGDVDWQSKNHSVPKHAPPTPIDTGVRRRRDPSTSRSDSYQSPASPPRGNPLPGSFAMSMMGEQPLNERSAPAPSYMAPTASSAHRRIDSEAAARERALEASERKREEQSREYNSQMKKLQQERERALRRQQQPPEPHRNDSSDAAPHGWVLVEEVRDTRSRPPRSGSSSNARSSDTSWNASSNQDNNPRYSPNVPTSNRPYPHSTGQSHSQIFTPSQSVSSGSFSRLPQTTTPTTLTRSHPPQSPASKYPNPHPHPRSQGSQPMGPPPGAIDPMMQQIDARHPQPITSSFYPTPLRPTPSTSSFNTPAGINAPTRIRSPLPSDVPKLHTVRSHPDLKPFNAPPPTIAPPSNMRSQNNTPALSVNNKRGGSSARDYHDGMFSGDSSRRLIPPPSPGRIQPMSPNRVFPASAYASFVPSPSRNNASMEYLSSTSGPASRGGTPGTSTPASLFSGGAFAVPAQPINKLRTKQSQERLGSSPQNSQQPLAGSLPSSSSIPSTNNRHGIQGLQHVSDGRTQRPQSDSDLQGDFRNRPSPIGTSSPAEALSRLEARRPSEPAPLLEVNSEPLSPIDGVSPIYVHGQATFLQEPKPQPTSEESHPHINFQSIASPALSTGSDLHDEGSDGTLRPGDPRVRSISLLSDRSDNDADVEGTGTMRPRANGSASPAVSVRRRSTQRRRSKAISSLSANMSTKEQPVPEESQEAEGEEDYYYEEGEEEYEDDEDNAIFWQPSPGPAQNKPSPPLDDSQSAGPLDIPKTNRTRGPSLTLQISPATNGQPNEAVGTDSASTGTASSKNTLTPASALPPHVGFKMPASPGNVTPVGRPKSFVGNDTWAIRPAAEDVYDHLQDFFPNHDLDKTFVDAGPSGGSSPTAVEPPVPIAASPQTSNLGNNRFRNRKSIRYVADERKKALERINARDSSSKATSVARKRSTKLWNVKVEEVTPGQLTKGSGIPPSIPESPTGVPTRATIKWVKGALIGQGTYGKVFLALNATTGEMLAVKQVEMPRTLSDQDNARHISIVNAIKSERETLENLDHPNIVQYLGFEETPDYFSVFLEYVPGGSVGTALRKHGKFSPDIIKSFTAQMLDGLAYLHDNKIIHRDVKADNILVDLQGICKISDFGISKKSDSIYRDAAMTSMQGSLFWMAPEMVLGDPKGYNAKVDIWSLGCVFLEMWAGKRPWEQIEFMAVMLRLGRRMAPPVPEDVVLDDEADDFRLKCFAQDPEERPTALELRKHSWLTLPPGWYFPGFPGDKKSKS